MSEAIEMNHAMSLPLRLGATAAGAEVVEDLTRMPHFAVCGGEAGERTAFMRGLVADMAARWSPNDARLILADGKGRAFAKFADLPHLVLPICDGFDAARSAVRWVGEETKRRVDLLASKTCMNIAEFNEIAEKPLPFVVIVVNEICDVLETSENAARAIERITQISRAVGIHLVFSLSESEALELANVLDACVPSRLVFKMTTADASKRLLGAAGAECLTTGSFLYRNLRGEISHFRGEVTTRESHIL
jgi:DNA segregation ATPase FtsK/SpoIIIE, S-DNA-T family